MRQLVQELVKTSIKVTADRILKARFEISDVKLVYTPSLVKIPVGSILSTTDILLTTILTFSGMQAVR